MADDKDKKTASGTETPPPPPPPDDDPLSDANLDKMNNTGTTWHHYK